MTERAPMTERIIQAADRLFYRRGIRAVGVDMVAAEAGISKRSLYDTFPSKDALVAAYLRHRIQPPPASTDPPAEQVLAIFDHLHARFVNGTFRGCPFVNAVTELAEDCQDRPRHRAGLQGRAASAHLFAAGTGRRIRSGVACQSDRAVVRGSHRLDARPAGSRRGTPGPRRGGGADASRRHRNADRRLNCRRTLAQSLHRIIRDPGKCPADRAVGKHRQRGFRLLNKPLCAVQRDPIAP